MCYRQTDSSRHTEVGTEKTERPLKDQPSRFFVNPLVFKDKHLHKKFLGLKPQAVEFFGGDTYIFPIVQRFAAQFEFQILNITTVKTYT